MDFIQGTAEFRELSGEFFPRRGRDQRKIFPDFGKFLPAVRESEDVVENQLERVVAKAPPLVSLVDHEAPAQRVRRSLDLDLLEGQITGSLITDEHCDL